MSPPTVADALAGARYLPPAATNAKTVLLVGAAGRLGERVLVRLLGTAEYRRVYVMAEDAMQSTEPKLAPLVSTEWDHPIDHVIAVVSEDASAGSTIFRKRTEIYSSLQPAEVMPLARQAASLGVSRFVLVTPTDVLSQPSAVYAQIANLMEVELHQIGFQSLLLVRPSDSEVRRRHGTLGERMVHVLVNTMAGLMVGAKHAPLSLDKTARAIVHAVLDAPLGINVIEHAHLHRLC